MKKPYRFPFPFPKSSHNSPYLFKEGDKTYPFPVPTVDKHSESPWPKSLCEWALSCKIDDDFKDMAGIESCSNAIQFGCPIYLVSFSEFASFGECKEVELFEIGQEESKDYTEGDLDEIIKNFNELKDAHHPPLVVLGHGEGQELLKHTGLPSAGWISKLWKKGKKLFADFSDVPQKITELIKKKAYRHVSAEIYTSFSHKNKAFGKVLRRVALLGADVPKIKGLDDVLALYGDAEFGSPKIDETIWIGGETMAKRKIFLKEMKGEFKAGEEFTVGEVKGKVVGKIEGGIEAEVPEGVTILFGQSLKTAGGATGTVVGKKEEKKPEYPKPPEKKAEEKAEEEIAALKLELVEKDKQLAKLAEDSQKSDAKIDLIVKERSKEKRESHLKEVQKFMEELKKDGLAPAFVDDSGIFDLAISIDWITTVKFSEKAGDEQTQWEKFSEILSNMVKMQSESKLFIPLNKLLPGDDSSTPSGVDEEGLILHKKIKAYSEKNKVSYEEAYKEVTKDLE